MRKHRFRLKAAVALLLALLLLAFSGCGEKNTALEQGKVLVVVFSYTGNTKALAENIAQELGADLCEIRAKDPYTAEDTAYDTDCRALREAKDPDARPEIADALPDISIYDTVFIGYPIWHGGAPKIIYTFLESVNLAGKRIIPFCTSEASPLGSSAEDLHPLAPDSVWDGGIRFEPTPSEETVSKWLSTLEIP